jgi:hypothetical protein
MDSSSSDEPIKYALNRLGISLIAAGLIGLVLSIYAIYAMRYWQGIWVCIAIFAFFSPASPVCIQYLAAFQIGLSYVKFGP